jgi:hypothetical protein
MTSETSVAENRAISPAWDRIPQELRERPQWCYTLPSDPDPTRQKAPRKAGNDLASSTAPKDWMPFELACRWAAHVKGHVGYMLSATDPFTCIDLDVKDKTTPVQIANYQTIIDDFASYSELSCGGRGMHVWVQGKVGKGCRLDGVEVYSQERFIICTGNTWINRAIEPRHDLLARLVGKMRGSLGAKPIELVDGPRVESDESILAKALKSEKFNGLWYASSQALEAYASRSEADCALMSLLALHSPNNEQCRRLFTQSNLFKQWPAKKQKRKDNLLNRILLVVHARDGHAESVEHGKQIWERILQAVDRKDDEWLVDVANVLNDRSSPPEFLTAQLLPAKHATLLSADGGSGKTRLSLAWAMHAAVGRPFLGKANTQAPVVFYSAEDDAATMRNLMARICDHFELDPVQVGKNFHLADASELESAVLFKETKRGELSTTPEYDRLKRLVEKKGARYVFVDNASEVFEGDEVKRQHTKAFIRILKGLVRKTQGAVLLLAHVNKETAKGSFSNGQEYSGNSAWNNSVRSRLYLGPASDEDPTLKLCHRKVNYGKKADPIDLAWTEGGLLEGITAEQAGLVAEIRDTQQIKQLVDIIRAATVNVPAAQTGPRTTHKVLSALPLFPQGMRPKRLNKLIEQAFADGTLKLEEYDTSNRKKALRIVAS